MYRWVKAPVSHFPTLNIKPPHLCVVLYLQRHVLLYVFYVMSTFVLSLIYMGLQVIDARWL